MATSETMSREEIMRAIEDGDCHAGVLFEEMNDKFDTLMETYDVLDNKIDRVDAKLEAFKEEVNFKFDLVFKELRAMRAEFKEEMRAMREELNRNLNAVEERLSKKIDAIAA